MKPEWGADAEMTRLSEVIEYAVTLLQDEESDSLTNVHGSLELVRSLNTPSARSARMPSSSVVEWGAC